MANVNVSPPIPLPSNSASGAAPRGAPTNAGDAPAHASFASTLSHTGRQPPAAATASRSPATPSARASAPASDSPPATTGAVAPTKPGGKKSASPSGDDPPAGGNGLPPAASIVQQIVSLLVPIPSTSAPAATSVPAATATAGAGADAAAGPPAAPVTPAAAPAPAVAPQGPPDLKVGPPRDPRPTLTPPALADSFKPVTEAAPIAAPPPAVPAAPPPSATPDPVAVTLAPPVPAVPGPVATAASPATERSAASTSAAAASTASIAFSVQTHRAVGPVGATDTSLDANSGSATADARIDPASTAVATLAPPAPPPTNSAVAQVSTPVGSPGWAEQLGDRVAVMVNQNLTNAQIKLSPAHLGPLEIRIAVADGQTSVAITAHSPVTHEALEAAAPRLREALGQQGFGSVSVDVTQQQFRERAPSSSGYEAEFSASAGSQAATGVPVVHAPGSLATSSRLDAYA